MKDGTLEDLSPRVAEIDGLDRAGCIARWQNAFERPPPKYLSPRFMKRVLIMDLQTRTLGGNSSKTDRILRQIAGGRTPLAAAKPGSHLVREWNGRTYQVNVTPEGYLLDGRLYRSLSAVARHITGAHWSGPRFFGVR